MLKSLHMITCLNYPFDAKIILRKKNAIKRELLLKNANKKIKIAVLGGSTTSEIKNILELFLLKNDIESSFYESDYNQYYEDAVFGSEQLENFNPELIYIHTSCVNIANFPTYEMGVEQVERMLNDCVKKFIQIWDSLSRFNCPIIQNNFDLPVNRSLGNLDFTDIHGKTNFINELNLKFASSAREKNNLYINDINYLSALIGLENWFSKSLWHTAKYAVNFDAIPVLANSVANIVNSILGGSKKCLVLDLDNTCWGGVIGDDGLSGIGLGQETAVGESFLAFQTYVKELKSRGVILAVCSKNNFDLAKEGFTHSDSVLKFEDFASFRANWDTKYENILSIANEINIGLDSLVLIDDNPVERNIVSSQLPSVSVPDVGNDVLQFINHIERNGFFEITSLSNDDLNRDKYYKQNLERKEEQALFSNYNDFLNSLEMIAEIKKFSPVYLERITQLINKTNQFNFTTKRYTLAEVEEIKEKQSYIKLYGKLTDKLGDNGLISIIIGSIVDKFCHIDLWIMSCRVFKRDVEFAMFDCFVDECKKAGIEEIIGYYYTSPKNAIVKDLYSLLGFNKTRESENGDSLWRLKVNEYLSKNRLIKIN